MSKELYTDQAPSSGDPALIPIGELVRLAEELLEQGNLPKAMGYLSMAHAQEPGNCYIEAMMERINQLAGQGTNTPPTEGTTALRQSEGQNTSSVAKPASANPEVQEKVRRLTLVACELFDLGDIDAAFESLLEAYLLDPASPLVSGCESKMQPFWEQLRTGGVAAHEPTLRLHAAGATPRKSKVKMPVPLPKAQTATSSAAKPDGRARVEELQRQLELRRREREQTMWRKASQPPPTLASSTEGLATKQKPLPRLRDLNKYDAPKFLRWLRGG